MDLKTQKIEIFIGEKPIVLKNAINFMNNKNILPISIGSEILKDERLFMTVSYNEEINDKKYSLKEEVIGNISDIDIKEKIQNSFPETNVLCHEMFVDNLDIVYFVYLIEN